MESEASGRREVRRGLMWAAAFVVLALGLAGVVAVTFDQEEALLRLAREAHPGWVALGGCLMTSGMVALAARWRAFFPAETKAGLPVLTSILLVGGLMNYALPGPAGELVGAAMAGRRFNLSAERALAAGIAARFSGLGLSGAIAIVLTTTGRVQVLPEWSSVIGTATLIIGGAAVTLLFLAGFPGLWKSLADATTGRVALLRGLHASVERFVDALASLRDLGVGAWLRGLGWALVGHGLVVGGIALMAHGLHVAPDLMGLIFTYTASTAGAIILFLFPGGQIGWDSAFTSLLVASAHLDLSGAVALALLVRLQQLLLVVLGAVALIRSVTDGTRPLVG